MERRLLGRNEGRTDDNIETIRKRFKVIFTQTAPDFRLGCLVKPAASKFRCMAPLQVFIDSSLPVIQHYEALGKVARINADRDTEEIYKEVRRLFMEL